MISFVPGVQFQPGTLGQIDRRNQDFADAWTWVHLGSGALAAVLGVPVGLFAAGSVAYEILEQYLEQDSKNPFGTQTPESGVNVLGDLAANALGYWLAWSLLRR